MGHRHLFNTSQMFDNEHDQSWNHMHTEQAFTNLARAGTVDNSSYFCPVENMPVDGVHLTSHWNAVPRSNGYSSSAHSVEAPHYQPDASGPSHDPFLHPPPPVTFCTAPENYGHRASSSNYDRQAWIDGGLVDLTMGNGRGPHKRKSPGMPSVCDRGSSSRYYSGGSSSDLPLSSEFQAEKPNIDSEHMSWDRPSMNPPYRSNGLSFRSESSSRNVRSRPAIALGSNVARTQLSSNPSHSSYSTNHHIDHSSSVDIAGQNSGASSMEQSHVRMSPGNGSILVSDTTGFSPETSHFIAGGNAANTLAEIGGYHHNFNLNRSPVVSPSSPVQSARGVRSSYSQRSSPAFRASSSSLHLGNVAPSDEGLQFVPESYSSRHPRPLSTIAWRSNDRNGRARISNERYRSVSDEAGITHQISPEGFLILNRTAFYGQRSMVDQHRDMRLDIDNMTYEELLDLGERIGSVNTGLSEDLILKCLRGTIYCSSAQSQEEGSCVICLEEYKDKDNVGALQTCGHDFHVGCIKKWLSMKNICPICKASALSDDSKEK